MASEQPRFEPNPVDYAAWGALQQMVYRDSITSLNNLKEKIRRCWTKLSQRLIDRAVDQWRSGLQAVVKAKGGHIEQLFEYDGYINVIGQSVER